MKSFVTLLTIGTLAFCSNCGYKASPSPAFEGRGERFQEEISKRKAQPSPTPKASASPVMSPSPTPTPQATPSPSPKGKKKNAK